MTFIQANGKITSAATDSTGAKLVKPTVRYVAIWGKCIFKQETVKYIYSPNTVPNVDANYTIKGDMAMGKKTFTVKQKHLKLLQHLVITSYDEYGTPSVDVKRPFGNSDIDRDMLTILGVVDKERWYDLTNEQRSMLREVCELDKLFKELRVCLQILTENLGISEGLYEASEYGYDWKKVVKNNE